MKSPRFLSLIVIAFLICSLFPAQQPAAARSLPKTSFEADLVPGEVLVQFNQSASGTNYSAQANAMAEEVGATVVSQYQNLALFSFDASADVPALSAKLSGVPGVAIAQPNYIYKTPEAKAKGSPAQGGVQSSYEMTGFQGKSLHLSWDQVSSLRTIRKVGTHSTAIPTFPNELTSGNLWAWDKIQADLIWGDKATNPMVCELDTGVDGNHADLKGNITNGFDFINNDSVPNDDNGHGTHIAGIISGKMNNGTTTAAGVSKSKVLAVKVLNAQGLGTSYSVNAGLIYCGKNTSVKILNMSLGSYATDTVQYSTLVNILGAGRLLVASAGNESTSQPFYPAAYADPDFNGSIAISNRVISVGAGRSPFSNSTVYWVDKDGHNDIDDLPLDPIHNEVFKPEQCATGMYLEGQGVAVGSNYGKWVKLVAPGEDIYSTTPTSYPFYLNIYEGVPTGYASMSGTSQAAALATGAAARVWSVTTTTPVPDMVRSRLMTLGDPLDFAGEGNSSLASGATVGYANPTLRTDFGGNDVSYGVPFRRTGSLVSDPLVVLMPYCWPTDGTAVYADAENMNHVATNEGAVYLNVARAMLRTALVAEVHNAANGSPLPNASVQAVDISGSTPIVRDTTKTISGNTYVVITDLPVKVTKTVPPLCDSTAQVPYRLQVSLSGYTNSYQVFNNLKDMDGNPSTVDPLTGDFCGKTYFDDFSRVGLLPTANLNFILDWNDPTVDVNPDSPSTNPDADLDMYLWLPPNAGGTDLDGVVGTGGSWDGIDPKLVAYIPEIGPAHNNKFMGMGTLLDPSVTGYPFSPYAVHNFDGGFQLGRDSYGNAVAPVESLTIKAGSKISTAPYFLPRYSGLYTLMVTDYSYPGWYAGGSSPATSSYLLRESTDPRYTAAIVRVWSTGKLVTSVRISQSTKNTLNQPTCSGSQRDWWKVLTINGATLTTVNTCDGGNAGGFIPYGN